MKEKFKVGDLVYCRYYKKKGIVSYVRDSLNFVRVKFAEMHAEVSYQSDGTLFPGEGIYLRKVKTFTSQDMLDFANYCIGEGFTSNATKRDLVNFLNSRKEVKNEGK